MSNSYKLIAVGNDTEGLLQFFGPGQSREAEAWRSDASLKTGKELGIKRLELDEQQILAMLNQNILLQHMMRAASQGAQLN